MSTSTCKSAERVFEILELFHVHKLPMRASVVSTRLQFPLSSTVVILKTMAQKGYLSFDPETRAFFPTSMVSSLGGWIMNARVPDPQLVNVLREVHRETGDPVSLNVRQGMDSECIYALSLEEPALPIRVGRRTPLCHTSAGIALLGRLSPEEANGIIERADPAPCSTATASSLKARVDSARRLGHSCGPSASAPGSVSFGKCVRNRLSGILVAIGVDRLGQAGEGFAHELEQLLTAKLQDYAELP